MAHRIFLLSPANAGGPRAQMLLRPGAQFDLAARLRGGTATIGEVYTFVSGLYFRGKLTYAERFQNPPSDAPGLLVITPCAGLVPPSVQVDIESLERLGTVPVDLAEPRYLIPVQRDAAALRTIIGAECPMILLGSVATAKYVGPLLDIYGDRLLFPADFVGRGDMSRGGLLLRHARAGTELPYVPVKYALRHGKRPPKLPRGGGLLP